MAIFATVNSDGDFTGFYPDSIHPVPPDGAFEITEEQWAECIDNNGLRRWKKGKLVKYTPPAPAPTTTPEPTKAELMAQIEALMAKVSALPADPA